MPADHETPDVVLVERERRAYLLDAVSSLPERLRHVVIGYFFEERPMQELADELGVTESRISQMRAEALVLLRDGLNSQLDPELLRTATQEHPGCEQACGVLRVDRGEQRLFGPVDRPAAPGARRQQPHRLAHGG